MATKFDPVKANEARQWIEERGPSLQVRHFIEISTHKSRVLNNFQPGTVPKIHTQICLQTDGFNLKFNSKSTWKNVATFI
jgi:hypothetical protein